MFARKCDPAVDAGPVRIWDGWMAKKLRGEPARGQEPLGGKPKRAPALLEDPGAAIGNPLVLGNPVAVAALAATVGGGARPPALVPPRARAVRRILFDDGSVCKCGAMCEEQTNCCEDWIELCPGEPPPAGAAATSGAAVEVPPEDDGASPPCPAPLLDLASSAAWNGTSITLTFLNHARYPLRLFLVGGSLAELVLLGTLGANGQTLRVAAADSFAWTLKTYSGVTVHQVAPERGAPSRTVNVRECDVSGGRRKMRLHAGW